MTTWVVADSGLFIASALNETYSIQAEALVKTWITARLQIAAPVLFQYELVSVIKKNVYRKTLPPETAIQKLDLLLAMTCFVQFSVDETLLRRAFGLATEFNRPSAYDAQYLALAERLNCEFWTVDERLFNAVKDKLSWVRWVGQK